MSTSEILLAFFGSSLLILFVILIILQVLILRKTASNSACAGHDVERNQPQPPNVVPSPTVNSVETNARPGAGKSALPSPQQQALLNIIKKNQKNSPLAKSGTAVRKDPVKICTESTPSTGMGPQSGQLTKNSRRSGSSAGCPPPDDNALRKERSPLYQSTQSTYEFDRKHGGYTGSRSKTFTTTLTPGTTERSRSEAVSEHGLPVSQHYLYSNNCSIEDIVKEQANEDPHDSTLTEDMRDDPNRQDEDGTQKCSDSVIKKKSDHREKSKKSGRRPVKSLPSPFVNEKKEQPVKVLARKENIEEKKSGLTSGECLRMPLQTTSGEVISLKEKIKSNEPIKSAKDPVQSGSKERPSSRRGKVSSGSREKETPLTACAKKSDQELFSIRNSAFDNTERDVKTDVKKTPTDDVQSKISEKGKGGEVTPKPNVVDDDEETTDSKEYQDVARTRLESLKEPLPETPAATTAPSKPRVQGGSKEKVQGSAERIRPGSREKTTPTSSLTSKVKDERSKEKVGNSAEKIRPGSKESDKPSKPTSKESVKPPSNNATIPPQEPQKEPQKEIQKEQKAVPENKKKPKTFLNRFFSFRSKDKREKSQKKKKEKNKL